MIFSSDRPNSVVVKPKIKRGLIETEREKQKMMQLKNYCLKFKKIIDFFFSCEQNATRELFLY
jgi:hypothetical protein